MNVKEKPWLNWRHITKLDPDKHISRDDLDVIVKSGTDAIMVSGTQNITTKNTSRLLSMLEDYAIPKILEPVTPEIVVYEGIDYLFVPQVLNTGDFKWLIGRHVEWIKRYPIRWEVVVPEAYIVLNPNSAVAKLTTAKTDLTIEEIIAYGVYAERYLHSPIVYVEYSGTYGDPEVVKNLKPALNNASLIYGGGIDSKEKAIEMKSHVDVIVVGNVVYDNLDMFLETIL
jgi:phosphoglycerol geranylgeranyltransferase